MTSNIVFESNVFPVNGSISSDKEYLSKIWDYNRIYSIDKRFRSASLWGDLQRKILTEKPRCALNPQDPCWGMRKDGDRFVWVSMCTKSDCRYFADCRSMVPYDPVFEKAFVPKNGVQDEYGYVSFLEQYSPNPVLIGDDTDYSRPIIQRRTEIKNDLNQLPDPFSTLLKQSGETPHQEEASEVARSEIEPKKCMEIVQDGEGQFVLASPETESVVCEPDIFDPNYNIFDSFVECSQESIICSDVHDSIFVDAGPGTGKTYTLIHKLNHMVTNEHVDPEGILVLCFTNAAVDEIKTRLKGFIYGGADRSLANVDIRTFHSFAWWLIGQANEELSSCGWNPVDMPSLSYESSLVKAGEVISRFGSEVVSSWEHFIVDEVQDLTNTLGSFVLKIINACVSSKCGVTVMGDTCQAIYDYYQETECQLNSADFYKALFRKLYGKSRFVFLTENHRQGSDLISLTQVLRNAILADDKAELKTAVQTLIGSAKELNIPSASLNGRVLDRERNGGSISLLLRNNGQTLKMSSDLRKRGVAHTLNISETKNNYAPWIADVFSSYSKATITEDRFCDLYEKATGSSGTETWVRLQRLMHTDNDVLDVHQLLNAIAVSRIDDSVLRVSSAKDVIVSNIHRSKGREYDCVIVDKTYIESLLGDSSPDEYRTLYVAITRPRSKLLLAPLQSKTAMQLITIFSTGRKRWGKAKSGKIAYLEFDSSKDLNPEIFAFTDNSVFSNISIGDEVRLLRQLKGGVATYTIVHEETDITLGSIGFSYIQDLMGYMKLDQKHLIELPSVINDIYVAGIYSQVVTSEYLYQHPELKAVAPNGVWKWIELVGIGHADYDVY